MGKENHNREKNIEKKISTSEHEEEVKDSVILETTTTIPNVCRSQTRTKVPLLHHQLCDVKLKSQKHPSQITTKYTRDDISDYSHRTCVACKIAFALQQIFIEKGEDLRWVLL